MSDTTTVPVIIEHSPPVTRLHPLVQMMQASLSGGAADPATLREMMALQREWQAGEAKRAYTHALVALKQDLPSVINKDSVVDFTSSKGRTYYRHASLANVMDQITDPLSRHGFALTFSAATPDNNKITVTCRLTHADGHSEELTLTGPPDTGSGRNALQGIASSITYLQRYAALALLGIATADMTEPDGSGDVSSETVDPDRNLRAVARLATHGRTREQAEAFLGCDVARWTVGDLAKLAAWVKEDSPSHNHSQE